MLIGIGVGAIVSRPLIAQGDGVFGDIQCTGLTVVNRSGAPAIVLRADETGNSIDVADKLGEPAVLLRTSELANRVIVRNPSGKEGIRLSAGKVANRVTVYNQVGIIKWEAPQS